MEERQCDDPAQPREVISEAQMEEGDGSLPNATREATLFASPPSSYVAVLTSTSSYVAVLTSTSTRSLKQRCRVSTGCNGDGQEDAGLTGAEVL